MYVSYCVFGVCLVSWCMCVCVSVCCFSALEFNSAMKREFHTFDWVLRHGGEGGWTEEGQPRHDLNGTLGVQIGTTRSIWNWKSDTNTYVICCCLLLFLLSYISLFLPLTLGYSVISGVQSHKLISFNLYVSINVTHTHIHRLSWLSFSHVAK